MDLGNAPRSSNVRDLRGTAIRAGGGLGIGGVLFAVAYLLLGGDPGVLLQNMEETAPSQQGCPSTPQASQTWGPVAGQRASGWQEAPAQQAWPGAPHAEQPVTSHVPPVSPQGPSSGKQAPSTQHAPPAQRLPKQQFSPGPPQLPQTPGDETDALRHDSSGAQ